MKGLRSVSVIGFVSLVLCAPAVVSAQSSSTAAIAGVVKDTTGAVVPGVTVEVTSPVLIERLRTVVTGSQGEYRVVDLPPGTFAVTFTLSGFGTLKREGVQLSAGFTAPLNVELKVGSVEETLTVTGASPVVDVQNTRTQNVLTREVLDMLPTGGKSLAAFAALTLGATPNSAPDVGGNRGETSSGSFDVHGGLGSDGHMYQFGMPLSHTTGSGAASSRQFQVNQLAVQEIVLQTDGTTADLAAGGPMITVVPKEGGNRLTLTAAASGSGQKLQSSNLNDDIRSFGISDVSRNGTLYDTGVGLGGPIEKDTVWFYTAHRWWGAQLYSPGQYYNKTPHTRFYTPDLSRQAYFQHSDRDYQGRITWQITGKNKLTAFTSFQCNEQTYQNTAASGEVAPINRYCPQNGTQAAWTYPATNRMLLEGGGTFMYSGRDNLRDSDASRTDVLIRELTTGFIWGAGPAGPNNAEPTAAGATSYSTPDHRFQELPQVNGRVAVAYVTGSHTFKAGFTYLWGRQQQWGEREPAFSYQLRNGVPAQITEFASPIGVNDGVMQMGLYAMDQWTLRRLTLNLGIRFDELNESILPLQIPAGTFKPAQDVAGQDSVVHWTDVSPRLGAAFDVFGNGRTAVKGFVGRFLRSEMTSLANATNPSNLIALSATRVWNDTNSNFTPDCDLTNRFANGECGQISNLNLGLPIRSLRYDDAVLKGYGARPYNWGVTASLVQELRPGMALSVGYFRRWFGNFGIGGYSGVQAGVNQTIDNLLVTPADFDPYCVIVPADSRLPGGGGNQICGLYDLRPAKFGQVDNIIRPTSEYGTQKNVYNGMDVSVSARSGKGQLVQAGVSVGRAVADTCFVIDSPQQANPRFCQSVPPWNQSFQTKVMASQPLPWSFVASAVYQNLSTPSFTANRVYSNAEIAASLGRDLGACAGRRPCTATVTIPLVAPNSLYGDRLSQLDLRLTKLARFGRTRVQGTIDCYNVLNAATVVNRNGTYGSTWQRPTDILSGRFFKFGAQVDW